MSHFFRRSISSQSSTASGQKDDVIERSRLDEPSPEVIDRGSDVENAKEKEAEESSKSDSQKLMFEFPLLHTLVKTVEGRVGLSLYLRDP